MIKNLPTTVASCLTTLFFCIATASCSYPTGRLPLSLVGYNHTDRDIGFYTVLQKDGATAGAGFLGANTGGAGITCCISLPGEWYEGMTVKVISRQALGEKLQDVEHTVTVPKWHPRKSARFDVHFLRNGQVKVFVTSSEMGTDGYPLTKAEAIKEVR